jgi:hypothetical protein
MNTSVVYSGPAESEAVAKLAGAFPQLPQAYLAFLGVSNGVEGPLGVEPGWFVVWPAEESLVASKEYEVPKYLPGYFAFGSNGGAELLVFRLSPGPASKAGCSWCRPSACQSQSSSMLLSHFQSSPAKWAGPSHDVA